MNKNLEERIKYMTLPAAATLVAGFKPEIQKRYDTLTPETKHKIKKYAAASLGAVIAYFGISKLYPKETGFL